MASHSEVETYLLCERKHYYSYGMRIEQETVSEAAYVGICGHAGLQGFYRALQKGSDTEAAIVEGLDCAEATGRGFKVYEQVKADLRVAFLLEEYFEYWAQADSDIEVLETEYRVKVPIGNGDHMIIVVDLISRQPGRGIVATDHKFVYDFFNPDLVDLSPQLVKYMAGLRMEGIAVNQLEYNEIRTRNTKDNAADVTLRFRRTPFKPTAERIAQTMQEHITAASRIAEFKKQSLKNWEANVLRTANKLVCQSCPFKDICVNDLNGWGHENLVNTEFKLKKGYQVDAEVIIK